jgi:uncharacterized protein
MAATLRGELMKIAEGEVPMHEAEITPVETTAARNDCGGPVAPWWHTAVVILILLGMSALGSVHVKKAGFATHHLPQYLSTICFEWALLGFLWIGLRLRRVPLAKLMGVEWRRLQGLGRDLGYAGAFWIVAMVVLAAVAILLRLVHVGGTAPQKALAGLAPQSGLDVVLWVALCVTAGICEELIFRGYLLRQFAALGRRVWVGVLISSLLFGASHGYEGLATMIMITVYGALFCVLARKSGSLRPGMMAHSWHDLFTGITLALLHHLHAL